MEFPTELFDPSNTDFLFRLPPDLEEELKDLEMSKDEWEAAGVRSGLRDASLHVGEKLDEAKLMEILGDSLPNFSPPIDETSAEWENFSAPHVEKSLMKNTCRRPLGRQPPSGQTEAQRVNDWAFHSRRPLGRQAKKDDAMFKSVLYGWDARGEHNDIEAKKVLRATQELLNTHLTVQEDFKREVSGLLTGLKEALKIFQSTIRMLEEAFQQRRVVEIGSTSKKTPSLPTPPSSSNKAKAPAKTQPVYTGDVTKDIVKLMEKIGKRKDEMLRFISAEELTKMLTELVMGMTEEDWARLETMQGKLCMNRALNEEIKWRSQDSKK